MLLHLHCVWASWQCVTFIWSAHCSVLSAQRSVPRPFYFTICLLVSSTQADACIQPILESGKEEISKMVVGGSLRWLASHNCQDQSIRVDAACAFFNDACHPLQITALPNQGWLDCSAFASGTDVLVVSMKVANLLSCRELRCQPSVRRELPSDNFHKKHAMAAQKQHVLAHMGPHAWSMNRNHDCLHCFFMMHCCLCFTTGTSMNLSITCTWGTATAFATFWSMGTSTMARSSQMLHRVSESQSFEVPPRLHMDTISLPCFCTHYQRQWSTAPQVCANSVRFCAWGVLQLLCRPCQRDLDAVLSGLLSCHKGSSHQQGLCGWLRSIAQRLQTKPARGCWC